MLKIHFFTPTYSIIYIYQYGFADVSFLKLFLVDHCLKIILAIYSFTMLGLRCCTGFSLFAASWSYSLVVFQLLAVVACFRAWTVRDQWFWPWTRSCGSWPLGHMLNSCGVQAWLLHSMWDLSGSGIELMPTALAGRFFITESPRKTLQMFILQMIIQLCMCVCVCVLVTLSSLILCDPTDYSLPGCSIHGDSPGKNTGVGYHALLQETFLTQGSNPGLLHCGQIL